MTIPIANPVISDAAREAVDRVLESGMIVDGEEVRAFEREFAAYVGTDHAIATVNGTAALHALLEAGGIGDGDTVVTTPFSFVASANAIVHAGANPIFGDIVPETYNLDPDIVRDILAERDDVAAILPVHLYGLPAAMDEFREIANRHDIRLFEDAAQAHGASFDGEMVGSIGDAGAFSFYPTKNMTTGEGGMVTTDDDELAARIRRLIDHGRQDRYRHVEVGYNYRMTNVQAVIGREQLTRLPEWVSKRRSNARSMTGRLATVNDVDTPNVPRNREHAFHQYTIRVPDRKHSSSALEDAGVGYGVYYPSTIPTLPAYDVSVDCPKAENASHDVISLPVHPWLTEEELQRIPDVLKGNTKGES